MVVRNSKTNSILLQGAGKGLKKNEKGEFINWTAKSRDGFDLKVYVENNCCENLTAANIRIKYPQILKYAYTTFNGALGSTRKSFNKTVRERGVKGCELLQTVGF